MPSPTAAISPLKAALELFREDRPLLLRLAVADETFRNVCEDYGLAAGRLAALRSAGAACDPAELADYVSLVAELEQELRTLVAAARRTGRDERNT